MSKKTAKVIKPAKITKPVAKKAVIKDAPQVREQQNRVSLFVQPACPRAGAAFAPYPLPE